MTSVRVGLLAIPEADPSSLTGLYTVLSLFPRAVPDSVSFTVELIGPGAVIREGDDADLYVDTHLGIPIPVQRRIEDVTDIDVLIVPSLFTDADGEWHPGRYPEIIEWMQRQFAGKTWLCSSCTGALLLAETGLLDGQAATQHWAFESTFRRNFPQVKLDTARVLVTASEGERIVMSGASAAWHDLLLHIVARLAGPAAARTIAKFFLLQWHSDSQAPYIVFRENLRHGDTTVLAAQNWLRDNCHEANPVETTTRMSGLPQRSFARRFRKATGMTPILYVQQLRIEAAKQYLETTVETIDEISARVGYEDPAFFRRVFKRITRLTPSDYRRKFGFVGTAPAQK